MLIYEKPNDLTFEKRKPLKNTRLIVGFYVSILTISVKMRYLGHIRQFFFQHGFLSQGQKIVFI